MDAEAPQMRNLRKAQWTRTQRRALKDALKARDVDGIDLIRGNAGEWGEVVATMPYEKLLVMIHGIGEITAGDVVVEFGVAGKVQLGALSFAQRATLADLAHAAVYGEKPIGVTDAD